MSTFLDLLKQVTGKSKELSIVIDGNADDLTIDEDTGDIIYECVDDDTKEEFNLVFGQPEELPPVAEMEEAINNDEEEEFDLSALGEDSEEARIQEKQHAEALAQENGEERPELALPTPTGFPSFDLPFSKDYHPPLNPKGILNERVINDLNELINTYINIGAAALKKQTNHQLLSGNVQKFEASMREKGRVAEAYLWYRNMMESREANGQYKYYGTPFHGQSNNTRLNNFLRGILVSYRLKQNKGKNFAFTPINDFEAVYRVRGDRLNWVQHYERGECVGTGTKICQGKAIYTELDETLYAFVTHRRENRNIVRLTDLQIESTAILKDDDCKLQKQYRLGVPQVSHDYIAGFMRRKKLRVVQVQRCSKFKEEDLKKHSQAFLEYVCRTEAVESFDVVANGDEIPMSVSGAMNCNIRTVCPEQDDGTTNIHPADFKRTSSVLAFGALVRKTFQNQDNTQTVDKWCPEFLPPVVMFPGQAPSTAAKRAEVYDPNVKVVWTKKAVITSDCMVKEVLPHIQEWAKKVTGKEKPRVLFLMDLAAGHKTKEALNTALSMDIVPGFIPAGMTAWLQWVDRYCAATLRSRVFNMFINDAPEKKRGAGERRVLTTTRIGTAMKEICTRDMLAAEFFKLGYICPQDQTLDLRIKDFEFKCPDLAKVRAADVNAAKKRDEEATQAAIATANARWANKPEGPKTQPKPGKKQQDVLAMFARAKRSREDE